MTNSDLDATRRALHAVAELVLAGPQYRAIGTIKLKVTPGGFGMIGHFGLRVDGTDLVTPSGPVPIGGHTPRSLAAAAGCDVGAPAGLYDDGAEASPDDELRLDPDAARRIADAYALGESALRLVEPDAEPILWPEHFDLGIRVGEVNLGVSPGDAYLAEPYAYIGVDPVPDGPFWNAPFGAVEPMSRFADPEALSRFLSTPLAGPERP